MAWFGIPKRECMTPDDSGIYRTRFIGWRLMLADDRHDTDEALTLLNDCAVFQYPTVEAVKRYIDVAIETNRDQMTGEIY